MTAASSKKAPTSDHTIGQISKRPRWWASRSAATAPGRLIGSSVSMSSRMELSTAVTKGCLVEFRGPSWPAQVVEGSIHVGARHQTNQPTHGVCLGHAAPDEHALTLFEIHRRPCRQVKTVAQRLRNRDLPLLADNSLHTEMVGIPTQPVKALARDAAGLRPACAVASALAHSSDVAGRLREAPLPVAGCRFSSPDSTSGARCATSRRCRGPAHSTRRRASRGCRRGCPRA